MSSRKEARAARLAEAKRQKLDTSGARQTMLTKYAEREKSRLIEEHSKINSRLGDGSIVSPGGDRAYAILQQNKLLPPMYTGINMFPKETENIVKLNLNTMKLAFMMGTIDENSTVMGLPYVKELFQQMNDLNYLYQDVFQRIEEEKKVKLLKGRSKKSKRKKSRRSRK
jgi:hypothetical protein